MENLARGRGKNLSVGVADVRVAVSVEELVELPRIGEAELRTSLHHRDRC